MDDEQIIQRGGDQSDVEEYAKSNGADLTEEDFMYEAIRQNSLYSLVLLFLVK